MAKSQKKSADPVQQVLRDHKEEWSALTKQFMSNLKGLRQGINGRGDSKVGIPPSKIQEPLPVEVTTLLSALTSQFQILAGGASSIVSEQSSYSQNRRKKQDKKPEVKQHQDSQPTQKQDSGVDAFLSNIASLDETLEKYGSNKLTRMWEYVKSPFSGDNTRTALLSAASDIYYNLLDLENESLSLDIESIPIAHSKLMSIEADIEAFVKSLDDSSDKESEKGPEKGPEKKPSEAPSENPSEVLPENPSEEQVEKSVVPENQRVVQTKEEAQDLVNQMIESRRFARQKRMDEKNKIMEVLMKVSKGLSIISSSSLPFQPQINKIKKLINRVSSPTHTDDIHEIYRQIKKDYENLIMMVDANVEKEDNDIKREELREFLDLMSSASYSTNDIIKVSHNYVTRLLKKYWVKVHKSDKTAAHRLSIAESVGVMKSTLQKIMNSLERGINTKLLFDLINLLDPQMKKIEHRISILNTYYDQKSFADSGREQKGGKPAVNKTLRDKNFRNEIQRNLKRNWQ